MQISSEPRVFPYTLRQSLEARRGLGNSLNR